MRWKKFTIYTTVEAEDLVSMMLSELGVEGVQLEDNVPLSEADTKGMFIDILPELGEDDGTSRVSFFLHLEDGEAKAVSDPGTHTPASEAQAQAAGPEVKAAGPEVKAAEVQAQAAGPEAQAQTPASEAQAPAAGEHEPESVLTSAAACDNSYTIADRIWSDAEIEELLAAVSAGLEEMKAYIDIGEGRIEEGLSDETDWRDNWKQFFRPLKAGAFLIKPTWETISEEDEPAVAAGSLKVIEIDPGTAFGTGSHETTRLCLEAIENYVRPGDRLMDIGTGSGILGIAGLKSGASKVFATELDPMCEPSIRDNMSFNGISSEEFELVIGNIIDDPEVTARADAFAGEGADVIVANILAPVIALLAGKGCADRYCRKGGHFITSGIIDTRLEEVKTAFENNPAWEIEKINVMGEWTSVIAVRK